ncbi:MAG: TlpA family protein disulfide reductase [Deltaproteobacteria bacterium]|nr:TlpA family protein disulfide reductase [Deltaproteobacteria bacterium]
MTNPVATDGRASVAPAADEDTALAPASMPSGTNFRPALLSLLGVSALSGLAVLAGRGYSEAQADAPSAPEQGSALVEKAPLSNSVAHAEATELSAPRMEISPEQRLARAISSASTTPGWHWAMRPQEVPSHSEGEITFVRLQFRQKPTEETSSTPTTESIRAQAKAELERTGGGPSELPAALPTWRLEEGQLFIPADREIGSAYQLVAFNKAGEVSILNPSTRDPHSLGFFLTSVPDVTWIGFQAGRPEELAQISAKAVESAHALGLHVLAPGKEKSPYPFTLSTVEGKVVSEKDFAGKTVVMLEWATWCMNCHETMRALFPLKEKFGNDLQIVMISHDDNTRAKMALNEMSKFPSGTTNVGMFTLSENTAERAQSDKLRELWPLARKGVNAYGIPWVTIVGKDGTLVFDGSTTSQSTLESKIREGLAKETPQTVASSPR